LVPKRNTSRVLKSVRGGVCAGTGRDGWRRWSKVVKMLKVLNYWGTGWSNIFTFTGAAAAG
jgi:hypothetical protein